MSSLGRKERMLQHIGIDMKNFDWEVYLLNYPELVAKGIRTKNDACNHYKSKGYAEKRSSQIPPSFNAERYMKAYSHLGLKSPRECYIHFMRIGNVIKKNEGFQRTCQPYRTPTTSQARRPVSAPNKMAVRPNNRPPTKINPTPHSPFQRPRRVAQTPPVVVKNYLAKTMKHSPTQPHSIIPSLASMNVKRTVREPKPGELVLHEPPSTYFARLGVLGPPKYLN